MISSMNDLFPALLLNGSADLQRTTRLSYWSPLFSIDILPLGQLIQIHYVLKHFYVDDTQLFMLIKPTDYSIQANLQLVFFDI